TAKQTSRAICRPKLFLRIRGAGRLGCFLSATRTGAVSRSGRRESFPFSSHHCGALSWVGREIFFSVFKVFTFQMLRTSLHLRGKPTIGAITSRLGGDFTKPFLGVSLKTFQENVSGLLPTDLKAIGVVH